MLSRDSFGTWSTFGARALGWAHPRAILLALTLALLLSLASSAWAASPHMTSTGAKTCASCHVPHQATSSKLFRDTGTSSGEVPVCLQCHDGTSAGNVKSGADSFAFGNSGHVLEGLEDAGAADLTNACSGCHKPHGDYVARPKLPGSTVNGVAISGAGNAWCLACHDDAQAWYAKKGTYPALARPTRDASGYPIAGTFAGASIYLDAGKNAHLGIPAASGATTRVAGDCLYCHAAHGSAARYDALVATLAPSTAASVAGDRATGAYASLCFGCHDGSWETSGAANIKRYATFAAADTGIGASGGHRIKSSGGKLPVNAPLPCYDCHNPHGSSRGNKRLLSDELGAGLDTGSASGVRRFCLTCHTTSEGLGWDGSTYASVTDTASVEGLERDGGTAASGPDGGLNWLRLRPTTGHGSGDTQDCYDCHGDIYGAAGSSNVHAPGLYDVAKHTATPPAASITILGTVYGPYQCTDCHSLELGPEHAKSTSSSAPAGCTACHPAPRTSLTPWNKNTCVQAGCHPAGSTAMHGAVNVAHATPEVGCTVLNCHFASLLGLARLHSSATTTVAGVTRSSCGICHGAGGTLTSSCSIVGCHAATHSHKPGDGVDFVSAGLNDSEHGLGDGMTAACSSCHSTSIVPLHANYCPACHGGSAPIEVQNAVANRDSSCTTCHPGQHAGGIGSHEAMYEEGCDCHDVSWEDPTQGCPRCHGPWTPVPTPSTSSDAEAAYVNDATINLSATDNVYGSFGIKATYYVLDGAPKVAGTQIVVPAPASGTQNHTLTFWSTDWTGNTEAAQTVVFDVSHDSFPPVTTSNVVSGATYAGSQTFTLTATDVHSAVAGTWWQLDGTAGAWTAGTSVPVAAPPSGTAAHTLYFYSRDTVGNDEVVQSVDFSVLAGRDYSFTGADQTLVVPSGVTTIGVTMLGGSGGGCSNYSLGGNGGRVVAVIPVTAGWALTVRVGGAGGYCSMWGTGGTSGWPTGGAGGGYGGGGGGSSSIWHGATLLAEAGGGGGGGGDFTSDGGVGGLQGTTPGGYQIGGTGGYAGGGGGGGFNAGTGGGYGVGGTGGKSYIAVGAGTLTSGAGAGNGSVIVRYSGN